MTCVRLLCVLCDLLKESRTVHRNFHPKTSRLQGVLTPLSFHGSGASRKASGLGVSIGSACCGSCGRLLHGAAGTGEPGHSLDSYRVWRRNFDCECSERYKYDAAACCAAFLPQSAQLSVPLVRAGELLIFVMPAVFSREFGSQRPLRVK